MLIVLGDWDEAKQLIGLLPVEDSSVRLLRSELAFVRGDYDGAQAEAEMALIGSSAERVHVLIRLADIALYLGDFSEAQRYGRSALDLSSTSDASLRARCYGIVAATEYFGGDIQAAETRFGDPLELLENVPEADRDRVIHRRFSPTSVLSPRPGKNGPQPSTITVKRSGCGVRSSMPAASCRACTRWDERGSAQATVTKPNATSPRPNSSRKASARPWNARRYGTRAQSSYCVTATAAAPRNSPRTPWRHSPSRAPATT